MTQGYKHLTVFFLITGIMTLFGTDSWYYPDAIAAGQDTVTSVTAGKPHSGGYNPHGKLTPDQIAKVAIQHMQEGRPNEAMHELDRAVMQYPTHAELFSVRGSLFLQMGKISDALRDFEASLAINPDDPKTLTNRAHTYRQFGRIEEALKDLDHALKLDPDLIAARFNRGSIYFSSNDFTMALADFEHCIAIDPHAPAPYFNRASTYESLGNRQAAIEDIKRFIELSDNEEWRDVASELLKTWQEEAKQPQTDADKS